MKFLKCYEDNDRDGYFRIHLDNSNSVIYTNLRQKKLVKFPKASLEVNLDKHYSDITNTKEAQDIVNMLDSMETISSLLPLE